MKFPARYFRFIFDYIENRIFNKTKKLYFIEIFLLEVKIQDFQVVVTVGLSSNKQNTTVEV